MSTACDVIKQTAKKEVRIALKEIMPRYQSLRTTMNGIRTEVRSDHKNLTEVLKRLLALEEIVGCVHPISIKKKEGPKHRVSCDTMKKIRARGELSQNELAILLDVSLTSINRWERGKNALSPKVITKIVFLRGMSRRQLRNYLAEKMIATGEANA